MRGLPWFIAGILLAGCTLFQGYRIGREYILVPVNTSGAALPCDRLWSISPPPSSNEPVTLICRFDGAAPTPRAAPDGIAPFFGVVPAQGGRLKVISANGLSTSHAPRIDPLSTEVLQQCPPPARRHYPLTVLQAALLEKWEGCLATKL